MERVQWHEPMKRRSEDSTKRISSLHSVITRSTSIATTTFVLKAALVVWLVFDRRIWFTEIARVYQAVRDGAARRAHGEDEGEEEEEKGEETKKDQRRSDRAGINCRNTGSSLSASATHGITCVGKCAEWYGAPLALWIESVIAGTWVFAQVYASTLFILPSGTYI